MTSGRLPVVGVIGSGTESHEVRATALGRWIAGLGVHLLTGGGGGVMESVSRAFHESSNRRGLVIGIVPSGTRAGEPKSGYPNEWVELPIYTHLPLSADRGTESMSRNHINVLSSDVIVAFPGAAGTRSEMRLALAYDRPIIAFVRSDDEIPDLPEGVARSAHLEVVTAFVKDALRARGLTSI